MMFPEITANSPVCAKLDAYADLLPGVSTVTNLVDLFLKHVFRPCIGEAKLRESAYFKYLDKKPLWCSAVSMVPVAGNAVNIIALIASKALEFLFSKTNALSAKFVL